MTGNYRASNFDSRAFNTDTLIAPVGNFESNDANSANFRTTTRIPPSDSYQQENYNSANFRTNSIVNRLFTQLYNIQQHATRNYTQKYNIAQLVNRLYTQKYNIAQLLNRTYTQLYNIKGLVNRSYNQLYNIRQLVNNLINNTLATNTTHASFSNSSTWFTFASIAPSDTPGFLVFIHHDGVVSDITSVTIGGYNMTLLAESDLSVSPPTSCSVWTINPSPVRLNALIVQFASNHSGSVIYVNTNGIDPRTPIGGHNFISGTGTAANMSISNDSGTGICLTCVGLGAVETGFTTTDNILFNGTDAIGNIGLSIVSDPSPGSGVSMDWTWSGATTYKSVGVELHVLPSNFGIILYNIAGSVGRTFTQAYNILQRLNPFAGGGNTVLKETLTNLKVKIYHTSLSYTLPTRINKTIYPPLIVPLRIIKHNAKRLTSMVHRFNISVTSTISSLRTEVTTSNIDTNDSTSVPE